MGKITILPETTKNPITLIGQRAGVCYGVDTEDDEKNYKRGIDCILNQHFRPLEYINVECIIDGYSARVIREWYTHIGGSPTRLQSSTRYVDYDFQYVTPPSVKKYAAAAYEDAMDAISNAYNAMLNNGVPKEDAAMVLPLGMTTKIIDKRNFRNVMDMSRQRLCNRAYWEFRDLFKAYCNALAAYSPEWEELIRLLIKPKCEVLGYCPEKKGCGHMPK